MDAWRIDGRRYRQRNLCCFHDKCGDYTGCYCGTSSEGMLMTHYMKRIEVYESGIEIWKCESCSRHIALVPNDETIVYDNGDKSVKHWLDIPGTSKSTTIRVKGNE